MPSNTIIAYPLESGLTGVVAHVYSNSAFVETVTLTENPSSTGRYVGTASALGVSSAYHYGVFDGTGARKAAGSIVTDPDGNEITFANLPTLINTIMTAAHGSGSWTTLNIAPSAYTLTVNVEDVDEEPVTTAQVMVVKAGDIRGPLAVNVDGQVVIPVSAGAWTLLVTAPGYNNSTSSVTISANTVQTKTLVSESLPEPDAGEVTGYLTALDSENDPVAGVQFQFVLKTGPGTPGYSPSGDLITKTSDEAGLVTIGFLQSSTYFGRRVKSAGVYGEWVEIEVGTESPLPIPEILGRFAA